MKRNLILIVNNWLCGGGEVMMLMNIPRTIAFLSTALCLGIDDVHSIIIRSSIRRVVVESSVLDIVIYLPPKLHASESHLI